MRIFVAGATGVIGRRLVPMLVGNGHNVTAMTRSADKAPAIEAQGAEAAVTDVFDAERLTEAVGAARPEAVIDQLTDLPAAMNPRKAETELAGNDRIRTEGTANLVAAARNAARRRSWRRASPSRMPTTATGSRPRTTRSPSTRPGHGAAASRPA